MKQVLVSIFLLGVLCFNGQSFSHSLSISSSQEGLQALAIQPELKNIAKTDFSDVRIYDNNNKELPYFLVQESFNYLSAGFKEYQISDKEVGKGHYTSFVVNNPNSENIQNIVLCVSNSDAWKVCNITGSDDNKQWFSVSDHIFMYNLYDQDRVYAYRTLHFPMINYKFIKIEINDLVTKPLNILKAGYFEGAISAGKLNELGPLSTAYKTDEKKKISHLDYEFNHSTSVDKITFLVKSPRLFKRKAAIYVNRTRTIKQREEIYKDLILEFELNSESANSFNLNNFREKKFFIEIYNEDNPPLEFERVLLQQLQTYVVADFKKGEKYALLAGNKKLSVPRYDIGNFRSKITQFLPTLAIDSLREMPAKMLPITAKPVQFWQEPWFLWTCIALASFVLFLFSLRVLKDITRRK